MAVGDRDGMDDLDRLFRHLVSLLAEQAPERLHAPFEVAELYQQILPYRQHRAALKLDTNQDYEMAVLRLLSGDREYATVEPGEVQDMLREEARAVNPDPGLFREYAAARVRLNAAAVRAALGARAAYASAPPDPPPTAQPQPPATPPPHHGMTAERQPTPAPPQPHGMTAREPPPIGGETGGRDPAVVGMVGSGRDAVERRGMGGGAAVTAQPSAESCPYCGQDLPTQRVVYYCPFCGGNVKGVECPKCGTGLEIGWTFCITCGQKVGRQ